MVDSQYADIAAAERGQAFVKGRLPQWLPRNSQHIWERANLDSSEVWIRFDLPFKACTALRDSTALASGDAIFGKHRRPEWWPEGLTERVPLEAARAKGLDIRVAKQGNDLIALKCDLRQVYVYRRLAKGVRQLLDQARQ